MRLNLRVDSPMDPCRSLPVALLDNVVSANLVVVMGSTGKIFISYAAINALIAQRVRSALEHAGFTCWKAPEDIVAGESWASAIARAVRESCAMVLLLSRESANSPEVRKEVSLAMGQRMLVIPFRLEDVVMVGELAYHLSNIQTLDAFQRDLGEALKELITRLRLTSDPAPYSDDKPLPSATETSPSTATLYLRSWEAATAHVSQFFTMLNMRHEAAHGRAHMGATMLVDLDQFALVRHGPTGGRVTMEAFERPCGRWLIAGTPGSGKSTLLKVLGLQLSRTALNTPRSRTLPVLLELGRFEPGTLLNLSLARESMCRFSGLDLSEHEVGEVLSKHATVWLLDGLDEGMIGAQRVHGTPLWREIEGLVSRYPSHSFIISTRKTHVPVGAQFQTINIRSLEATDRRAFVARYLEYFQSESVADNVIAAIPESLRDVADTPLVLSMILSIFLSEKAVPATVADLYRAYIAHVLDTVEAGRRSKIAAYVKDMALAQLGFAMLTSGRSRIRQGEALVAIGTRVTQLAVRHEADEGVTANEVLDELVYSGLLLRRDFEVSFLHLSLLEYFAECEMRREFNFTAQTQMDQYFLRNPQKIQLIVSAAAIRTDDRVIELGAGIGSVAKHFPPSASLHLVDLDADLAKILRFQFPNAVVMQCDAADALTKLPCDVVISNLPFFLTAKILQVLKRKSFRCAIMSVRCDEDLATYCADFELIELGTLDEEDFFPRQPFKSRLIQLAPARLAVHPT